MDARLRLALAATVVAVATFLTAAPDALAAANPLPTTVGGGLEVTANSAYGSSVSSQPGLVVIIGRIIRIILGFVGTIFFLLVIYGGLLWMTSAGDQEKVKRARAIIANSSIGLAVVLAAYGITWFVTTQLLTATGI